MWVDLGEKNRGFTRYNIQMEVLTMSPEFKNVNGPNSQICKVCPIAPHLSSARSVFKRIL